MLWKDTVVEPHFKECLISVSVWDSKFHGFYLPREGWCKWCCWYTGATNTVRLSFSLLNFDLVNFEDRQVCVCRVLAVNYMEGAPIHETCLPAFNCGLPPLHLYRKSGAQEVVRIEGHSFHGCFGGQHSRCRGTRQSVRRSSPFSSSSASLLLLLLLLPFSIICGPNCVCLHGIPYQQGGSVLFPVNSLSALDYFKFLRQHPRVIVLALLPFLLRYELYLLLPCALVML